MVLDLARPTSTQFSLGLSPQIRYFSATGHEFKVQVNICWISHNLSQIKVGDVANTIQVEVILLNSIINQPEPHKAESRVFLYSFLCFFSLGFFLGPGSFFLEAPAGPVCFPFLTVVFW